MTAFLSKKIDFDVISLLYYLSLYLRCNGRHIKSTQNLIYCPRHAGIGSDRKRGRLMGWTVKPEKRQQKQTIINQLFKPPILSQLGQKFLERLKRKQVSLKQQEVLSRIEAKGGQG